jgi:formylmethanofuran dehydrogenase subunit E
MADTLEEQKRIDAEWSRAARTGVTSHAKCPDCDHRVYNHTTRVGEGIRICSSCPCDRYAHYS